ncbi:unnamed protein product, partial [Linum tenue]
MNRGAEVWTGRLGAKLPGKRGRRRRRRKAVRECCSEWQITMVE